jgi:hypothetical protein
MTIKRLIHRYCEENVYFWLQEGCPEQMLSALRENVIKSNSACLFRDADVRVENERVDQAHDAGYSDDAAGNIVQAGEERQLLRLP